MRRDLAEVALGHALGDSTEAAYARSDMIERRRPLVQKWRSLLTECEESIRAANRSRRVGQCETSMSRRQWSLEPHSSTPFMARTVTLR